MSIMEKPRVVDKLHKYRRSLKKMAIKGEKHQDRLRLTIILPVILSVSSVMKLERKNIIPGCLVLKISQESVMKRMPLVYGRLCCRVENY